MKITAKEKAVIESIVKYAYTQMGGTCIEHLEENNFSYFVPNDLDIDLNKQALGGVMASLQKKEIIRYDDNDDPAWPCWLLSGTGLEIAKTFMK